MESDPRVTIVSTETHSDFTLSGLMESDAGLYTCTASNLLGMDSVEITVTVQGQSGMIAKNTKATHLHGFKPQIYLI